MTHKERIVKHYKERVVLARGFLKALRLLLKKYEKEDWSILCPLCEVSALCSDCPWHVLINSNCDYMQNINLSGHAKNRMKQIERWIKAYEEALKEIKEAKCQKKKMK